jgi:hypothetical protein
VARSDGFVVDPRALSDAHAGIGRLIRNMDEFTRLEASPSPAVFGHAELAVAAEEFHGRWESGVAGLARDTESIHRRLGDTIAEYLRVEESIVGRLRGDNA